MKHMLIKTRRLPALAALALTATLALSACGSDDGDGGDNGGSGGGGGGGSAITMIPKSLGNPYFDASTAGAERAAGEFDGSIEEVGPTGDAGPDSQVPFIQTATQQGVGALVVSANDPSALCDSLEQAQDVDIKVVTFDSDTECRDLFVNQADAQGIASKQIELIADQIGGSGDIAILSAAANATNQNEWISLMEEDLAANYPDINLVDTVYGDDDDQKSFDQTAALLQANPNLKGIVSPTTVGIAAAARYLSTSEFKGKVALTGLGAPSQMKTFIDDGTVTEFALWNPDDLGYLAAYAAEALVSGDISGEEGDTFTAGDLGEYTVGADGIVVLGEPFVFDASNINDFDF
ncbi:rhamnose ABC transporter substrate-binding protein [Nocardioides sp. C4-1]|uniref:rhamnose ABC transporter substrate-binding protein n=1 Tax=Nocardioides sp. C4-1 TaxID=3151851 RepID=UPI003265F160